MCQDTTCNAPALTLADSPRTLALAYAHTQGSIHARASFSLSIMSCISPSMNVHKQAHIHIHTHVHTSTHTHTHTLDLCAHFLVFVPVLPIRNFAGIGTIPKTIRPHILPIMCTCAYGHGMCRHAACGHATSHKKSLKSAIHKMTCIQRMHLTTGSLPAECPST
jgi:hypothetical protein